MKSGALLAAVLALSCGARGVYAQAAAPGPKPPLGVNIEWLADWARMQPFVDMMKTSRPWGTADAPWQETSQVDALGWPTGDAGVVVAVRTVDIGDSTRSYQYLAPGTYLLRFTGKATVTPTASKDVDVRNYRYDAAANRSSADVVVGNAATQMILSFRNTAGGVRDVSLLRPGYADQQTFTNEFTSALAPFRIVRFMDYLASNQTRVRAWSDRTTPKSATQATGKGGAYEYIVQIANELDKDVWINIPVLADDDHVRALAQLLKQTLAPGRVLYLEYSNELWNTQFPQTADNRNVAVGEAIAGDTTLTQGTQCTQAMFNAATGGDCNAYWAGYFRVGKRTVRISQIFAEVFGKGAINRTIRPVYAAQWANPSIAEQVLRNIAKYRGRPSSLIYGVAVAPYFNIPQDMIKSGALTAPQLLQALQASIDKDYGPYFTAGSHVNGAFSRNAPYSGGNWTQSTHKALADYYKIKSLAYEGGVDMGQSSANALAKLQASRDPQMGELVKRELAQWFGCGNDVFMYFNLTSAWNQHGYWGLTNDPGDLDSPKYAGARQVAQSALADWKTCR